MAKKIVELLAPASSWPMLNAVIKAGADSVYFGVKELNMRITARNFELSDLPKIVELCNDNGVKAFLTLNTIVYEEEMPVLKKIITAAKKAGVHSIIAFDPAVITLAKKVGMDVHISTQASVSNSLSALFYKGLGASRVNLARELTLEQIRQVKKKSKMEVEVFCHGAICVSISGRCFISQFLYNKSANRGDCIQPCRREYIVTDPETKKELKVGNNFIMSPKDLCTIEFIDQLIDAGVDALKIEGRAKQPEYAYTVVSSYRKAIDAYYEGKLTKALKQKLKKDMLDVYNRGFHSGFLFGKPVEEYTDEYGSKAKTYKRFLGKVTNYYPNISVAEVLLNNGPLNKGDDICFIGKTTGVIKDKVRSMQIENEKVDSAKKGDHIGIKTKSRIRPGDELYVIEDRK